MSDANPELDAGPEAGAPDKPARGDKPIASMDRAFLTYLATAGDIQRTALITRYSQKQLREVSERENWAAKLKAIETLKKDGRYQQVAIELSRVASFVQASRFRELVDRAMAYVIGLDDKTILWRVNIKGGQTIDAKILLDLAKAMETAQTCCARALGDKMAGEALLPKDEAERTAALDVYSELSRLSHGTETPPTTSESSDS